MPLSKFLLKAPEPVVYKYALIPKFLRKRLESVACTRLSLIPKFLRKTFTIPFS